MTGICIIGSGIVGTIIGCGFEQLGHDVTFYDINPVRIAQLQPDHSATTDLKEALETSSVSFICVPTPFHDGFDASYLISAVESAGRHLADQDGYHLLVVKSTVLPTTTERIVIPRMRACRNVGEDLGICVNPEFLTEISKTWTGDGCFSKDFFSEDRIVIGELDTRSGELLEQLYRPLQKPIFRVSLRTAEMIKYAANCILATKISYWNEISRICERLDVDSHDIASIVGLDPRIGKYGTVHGKAFGGKCLPKDLKAFIEFSREYGDCRILRAVDGINEEMKEQFGVRE
jgi:UDPglucose 6-dehydrogenase